MNGEESVRMGRRVWGCGVVWVDGVEEREGGGSDREKGVELER